MDGSKRSTKSNAFFTGIGKTKRIVLFDTLIKNHSEDEILAILAHEIGHYKKLHIYKTLLLSVITSGVLFYLLSLMINNIHLFNAFKMDQTSIYVSLVLFSFIFIPINYLFSILSVAISRKHEYEADSFAIKTTNLSEVFIDALKKLSIDNLSNLTPHSLIVFLEYSHPPVLKRIEAIRKIKKVV